MTLIDFRDLKRREAEIPIISDRILVDLVNSIQVNDDLISFRQRQGFLGHLLDNLTGADRKRQLAIDKNVNVGMQSLHDWVLDLANNLNVSNNAIADVEEKLLEARQALRNHRQELDLLTDITKQLHAKFDNHEKRLSNLEVYKAIDRAFMAWKSERTYQGFDWAIQVAFITREIVDYTLTDYERSTNDFELRQYLIDSLMDASKDIPNNSFSLVELFNLANDRTSSENRKVAAYILESESISSERLVKTPYLFALGKTLELAQPSDENRPGKAAAQAALELCRNRKMLIYPASSKQQFIESIVNETANDRLAIRSNPALLRRFPQTTTIPNVVVNQSVSKPISQTLEEKQITTAVKIGLVLAGGGAKGAYQSGAVKYFAEIDFTPQIIAGTSIGALNGAILAANAPFKHATDRLWELWTELGQADIIRSQLGRYLLQALASIKLTDDPSLFDPTPLEVFLENAVNPQQLRAGIELWVAVFPSAHNSPLVYLQDRGQIVSTLANVVNSHQEKSADYIHVQSAKTDPEIYQILLASAAIPMAFAPRKVEGTHYVDGWLGDNVPRKALAQRGCTHAIVIHLENGELWSRHDFPNQTIIEVRPQEDIGGLKTLLDFSPARIKLLQKRGYRDAKRCLEPILKTLSIEYARRDSFDRLQKMTKRVMDDPPVY